MKNETVLTQEKRKNRKLRRLITLVTFIVALCSIMAISTFADEAFPDVAAATAATMTDLVENIFDSFQIVIKGIASGMKDAFENLIYEDPLAAEPQFSTMVIFVFVMAGVGIATGILYKMFGLIASRRRGGA